MLKRIEIFGVMIGKIGIAIAEPKIGTWDKVKVNQN